MAPAIIVSATASLRIERALAWLAERRRDEEVLILGASTEAAAETARLAAVRRGACFGWQRSTLGRTAAALAGPALAARGLAPVGALPLEALVARVVDGLRRTRSLGRFQVVAELPGLPRALARTLAELRLAGVEPERVGEAGVELGRVHRAYEEELSRAGLADRALVFRFAAEAARAGKIPSGAAIIGRPLLLVDVPVNALLERELVAALAARAPGTLATIPEGDARSLTALRHALRVDPERLHASGGAALCRLQTHLFSGTTAPPGELGDDVVVLSAPGESRECVEIARLVQREAARGVPFDRMAVLLRAPAQYRAHLEEALRRASIPAHFARGTVQPDPAGRAFVALLACSAEELSARRFAEYLSLGQVPAATEEGEPPEPPPAADRWVPPDEELAPRFPPEAARADEDEVPNDPGAPSVNGTLRAPRRWERLLVESAVIGGLDRWEVRLAALERKLELDLSSLDDSAEAFAVRVRRSLADLHALRRFALPLLRALSALPERATWGEWIEHLGALATRALRRPDRVLSVLAELSPMAAVGPVDFAEVRLVLGRRLTELVVMPEERAAGHVFVAPVEAARGLAFDVVFVPGVAERLFPQKVGEEPILRDRERARLDLPTNDDRIAGERLALRIAVGAARSRLFLSYPRVDMDQSRPRVPSFYGLEVMRAAEGALPGFDELARRAEEASGARIGWPAPRDPKDAIDEAEYDLALLEQLFRRSEQDTVGTARYLLSANGHLARALRSRARRWTVKKWMPVDGLVDPGGRARAALDRQKLGARSYSPTALQNFASCPYKFLLQAIHRLSPRETPEAIEEMDPLQRGSLVHETLFELLETLREEALLPVRERDLERARDVLDESLNRVAARFREELSPAIERVWEDGIASVRADLREWLRRAAQDGDWTPWRFELSFGLREREKRDPHSREEPVLLDCGIQLRGSIDLVEQGAYGSLRATDYKTGKVRARPGATVIGGGEVLQPVLYALALEKLFPASRVELGRLYYCTSAGGFEEVQIPLDGEAREAAQELATVVGGALDEGFFPAAPAPGACTYCEYRPVCGPYEEIRAGKKSRERLLPLSRLRARP
ncbi:ATP-dependent nuclease, subunit B [Minicystis rosea]|nr:ATP-dependent nuclease, subunit B [Minicystis rosea]